MTQRLLVQVLISGFPDSLSGPSSVKKQKLPTLLAFFTCSTIQEDGAMSKRCDTFQPQKLKSLVVEPKKKQIIKQSLFFSSKCCCVASSVDVSVGFLLYLVSTLTSAVTLLFV